MKLERLIRMMAGTFMLAGLALGRWVDGNWYLFSAFVGLNLIQSAFTGWCLAESILKRTIYKPGNSIR